MDTQQQKAQPSIQPVVSPPAPTNNNSTNLIIVFIVILAVAVTGVTYFLVSRNKSPKQTQTTTADTPIPTAPVGSPDGYLWEKYSDTKIGYYFYYPNNWTATQSSTESTGFELKYIDTKTPGAIVQKVVNATAKDKQIVDCQAGTGTSKYCYKYPLTAVNTAYINSTIEGEKVLKTGAVVSLANGEALSFTVSTPNLESYKVLTTIVQTIQFKDQKPLSKMRICPDSWSADKTTATYHGINFAATDIDSEYLKNTCKQ